jgi:hypothetical protein
MSALRSLPFSTADSALTFELLELPAGVHSRTDETLDAYSDVNQPFVLQFAVDPDVEELAACLPEGRTVEDLELCLVSRSTRSRTRTVEAQLGVASGILSASLDPSQLMGKVELTLVARLRRDLDRAPGYAHLKGSTIATQTAAVVWFDEPPTFSGDALEVLWRDFDEDPTLEDGHLFAIGLEGRPVIYLNEAESMSPLRTVLESKATHGVMARTRDVIYQQIVHQAWTSILGHCFLVVQHHGDEAAETVLDELDEWMVAVLSEWAPAFVPEEQDPEEALIALVDRVRESGNEFLLVVAPAAIQRKFDTMKGFRGLATEFAARMS